MTHLSHEGLSVPVHERSLDSLAFTFPHSHDLFRPQPLQQPIIL